MSLHRQDCSAVTQAQSPANKKEEIQTLTTDKDPYEEKLASGEYTTVPYEPIKKPEVVLNKNGKVKIDQDLMLECIKEKLTIDEIAEMNSWDVAEVARMY